MKELEQLKSQFDKLNEELEKIDSIGIIRLESIISELDSIKASAKSIVENPGKYSEDIIMLSEHAIGITKDVDALTKMVKVAYEEKNKLKSENERDTKSVKDTIARNQEALTEAQVREKIIEGRLFALEEKLRYLENSKKILIEGGNLIVKKSNKKEKVDNKEETEKKEKVDNKNPEESELVTIEHPSWNIPKFWNPDLTEDQYKYALSKGISEPYGVDYEAFIESLGLDPNKRAIFWHPLLTEEQILDALANDIYQPYGPNYNKFLNNLGLSPKYNALLQNKATKKIKQVEKEEKKVEESNLVNPLEKTQTEEMTEEPKRKRVFISEQLFEDDKPLEPQTDTKEEKMEEPKAEIKEEPKKEDEKQIEPKKEILEQKVERPEEQKEEIREEKPELSDSFKEETLLNGVNASSKEANDNLWTKHSRLLENASLWLGDINASAKKKVQLPKKDETLEGSIKQNDEEEMKISLDSNNSLFNTDTNVGLSNEELDDVSNELSESDLVGYLRR